MLVIWNADSNYVLPIYGQSIIIWHIKNLLTGVSTLNSIVQYVVIEGILTVVAVITTRPATILA
jgi:hypothetical protein